MDQHDGERQPWRVRALRRLRGLDGATPVEPAGPVAPAGDGAARGGTNGAVLDGAGILDDGEVVDGEVVDGEVVEREVVEREPVERADPERTRVGAAPPVTRPRGPGPRLGAPPPAPDTAPAPEPARTRPATDLAAERRRRRFQAVVRETYPSVADHVVALAEAGADADLDDWLEVARVLSDDLRHRSGGLSAEARSRALEQTVAAAIEAQARSSARLAGYADDVHDDPSPFDGDPYGTTVWQHYVCPEARLALQSLHGEALGNWLDALSELWEAANAVYVSSVARADAADERSRPGPVRRDAPSPPAPAAPPPSGSSPAGSVVPPVAALEPGVGDADSATAVPATLPVQPLDRPEQARVRLKAALVKVEELSLW